MTPEQKLAAITRILDLDGPLDVCDNLEGAIIDLERTGSDAVSVATLERVSEQLARVYDILTEKP